MNKACPKDNYPTPFIDQIIDACAWSEVFSFMDGFSGYNQIQIKLEDQHKTAFIFPWGTFAYRKMPFQSGIIRRDVLTSNQAHKNRVKSQYDKTVKPRVFSKGELVLLWDQDKEPLGVGEFKAMWLGPYVLKLLSKGAYELVDFDGNKLPEPRNGLYLKKYYA